MALAALCIAFSYALAPAMNAERSGSGFVKACCVQVKPTEELALVAYKEQFLLYLDRPTVNFGHRRWLEGPQESYDSSAWLNAGPMRVLLVPEDGLEPCFEASDRTKAGRSSDEEWFLVRGQRRPIARRRATRRRPFTTTRNRADPDQPRYVRRLADDLISSLSALFSNERVDLA